MWWGEGCGGSGEAGKLSAISFQLKHRAPGVYAGFKLMAES
jgi:hypothetical protein